MNGLLVFEASASAVMGFVIMWIGYYFIDREQTFTAAEFGGFITAFFGGAILEIYTTQLDSGTRFIFWFYPIGLFIGLVVYHRLDDDSKMKLRFGNRVKKAIDDKHTQQTEKSPESSGP
jgi:hypothetical protein